MRTCAACGYENRGDDRFCASCGSELWVQVPHEVRKTVTVLFADVAGSTALGERLDPESLRRIMARYFDAARGCVERHGGTIEKFIGDAVMAVFGVPTVHEDDALRAVRAASELRHVISSLNLELERDYGLALQVRIGLNTGEVVVGTDERLATGDAVNVAARLEQAAGPDEILVGDATFRLARDAVEVESVERLIAKGKAAPVVAHRLVRVVEGAEAFKRRLDAPFVGRAEELALVRGVFEQAVAERRCRLVTVLGPPGIGKSRLAREVASDLGGEAAVLAGRCLPYGEGITYWPLREIFGAADAEHELDTALAAGGPEEIFWAVRKAIERRARERPLALVVEDIHWAEPTLLDLVEHLTDWTRDAQLLLLCLARPELLDERPAWGSGRPNAELLTLEPLPENDADALIAGLLGESELGSSDRSRILAVAEGNPLFVEQLVAAVGDGAEVERVPSTVQALLSARLDMLSEDEGQVLECASVVGLEFEWDALAQLSSDRRRPPGTLLFGLVRKELIRPHDAIDDTFGFRHMLIRDVAYERISKERRAELHERVAYWLDGRGEEFDEIVGYHLEQAYGCLIELGVVGERGRALAQRAAERLAASGLRAFARGDSSSANLLDRATALFAPDDPSRLQLLPTLGRALREAAQMDRADAVLSEAVERGRAAGERAVVADAGLALADLRFHRTAQTGVGRQDVLRELDAAISTFQELGDVAGLARALTLGGKLRFWAGQAAAATADFERAADHARRAGDRAEEAESLQYAFATMHRGPMPIDDALARFEELRPQTVGNRRLEVELMETRALFEAHRGRFDVARELAAKARTVAEEQGLHALLASHVGPDAGAIELLAGDAAAAERELRPACEGLERVGELGFLSSVAPLLVDALIEQDRDEEALALTERWHVDRLTVPEDVDAQAGWRRVRARLLARRGDIEEAERLGREAVTIAAETDYFEARALALADLADVLWLAGRPEEAARTVQEALALYEGKGSVAGAARLRERLAKTQVEV
jgi:class 3 adenylate cyclase/tetratricopeptide (TPR) repeat protein